MPGTETTVRHECRGRVLVVRIERAANRNATDRVTADGIDRALTEGVGAFFEKRPSHWTGH
jgi:enoyl-CoA hydratase/carnithine racemase